MHVEAAQARCRSFSLLRLLNAGLPWMASARGLADTEPVASVTHWLLYHVKLSACAICPGTGQGWYMGGPGLERVWNDMERGLERNGPLQHSAATVAHLYQIRKCRAEATQWAILRLPAGSS